MQLVQGGEHFFSVLENIIAQAQHELHLQTYIFDSDETGTRIANALMAAAQRGVRVFMVLDAYGSANLSKTLQNLMTESGIKLRFFGVLGVRDSWAWGRRLHHKIVVADRYTLLVGGINISNRYAGYGGVREWLDFAVHIEGEKPAQQAVRVCKQVYAKWFAQYQKKFIAFSEHPKIDEPIAVQLKQNDWLRSKNQIAQGYATAIRAAKTEIIIANSYFLPSGYFRRLLKNAAKRGVKVKILLSGISDVPLVSAAMHYLYRYLLRNGIEVYEWTPSILHAKVMCVDGKWCTIGSYNLNYLSAYASIEFNACVLNDVFAHNFGQHLSSLLRIDSVQVKKDEFMKKTNPLQLLGYWLAFKIMKLSEALLINFPGQHFFRHNQYA